MKYLCVTYCFDSAAGPTAADVYIRGLHVALALHKLGHSVLFLCPGRENHHSPLTERAAQRLTFIDLPFRDPDHEWAETVRRLYMCALTELAPDAIIIGEAPLAGPLLGVTLAGAELGIPLIVLDTVASAEHEQNFCQQFGTMFDGMVLSRRGLRRQPTDPASLCRVPSFAGGAQAATASQSAADFIIRLSTRGCRSMHEACARLGFTDEHLLAALRSQQGTADLQLHRVRAAQLRTGADFALYAVVCTFERDGARHSTRFWGRRYRSAHHLQQDLQTAARDGVRRIHHASADDALLLEEALGAAELPPLLL